MKRSKYVELVADQANVSYGDAKKRMDYAKEKYGITYKNFYTKKLYYKNEIRLEKMSGIKQQNAQAREEIFNKITEASSLTKEDVNAKCAYYKQATGYGLSAAQFYNFKIYEMNDEEAIELATNLRDRKILLTRIKPEARRIYAQGESFDGIESKLQQAKDLIGKTLSYVTKEQIIEKINDAKCDISNMSEEELNDLIIDIEFMKVVFDYTYIEYFMFGFKDKSLEQRVEFLTITEKRKYAERVCDPFISDTLDSKWLTYNELKDFFKREAILVEGKKDYRAFEKLCKEHGKCIAKPLTELKGEGIKIFDFTADKRISYKKAFKELIGEDEAYIVEELIKQDDDFGAFNPDSVNTVRIITFLDGDDNVHCKWTFIRVGRKGSHVDNAGAGGVFAAIDTQTGIICTNAFDENGLEYEEHPDTGIKFAGFQIPKWNELLEKCESLARGLEKVRYIGWDFTYTTDKEWVLVEANIQPGCRAIQSATGKGIRREFLNLFGGGEDVAPKKDIHVMSVSQKADISYEEALEMMDDVKEKHGIPYHYYDIKNLHLANDIRMIKYAESYQRIQDRTEEHYQNIFDNSGMTREQVDELIDRIRIVCNYRASAEIVDVFKLYELSEREAFEFANKLKRRNKLSRIIKSKIKKIDKNELTYADIEDNVEKLRAIIKQTIPESVIENIKEPVFEAMSDREFGDEELLDLIVDINLTKRILEFNTAEYLTYHFENKTIEERHKFIANPERLYWTKMVNDLKTSETLDDKYQSYLRFKDKYKRNVLLMETDDCFDEFAQFCKTTPVFVKKPLTESQGKGVGLVKTDESTDLKELFRELREDSDRMVLEAVIEQSEITGAFNKDSVNTVRIITFNCNGEVRLMWSFFRTGRKGSFVDNAGSGGVFAGVDVNTGILESDGGDELGRKFLCHPESGIKYKGFQLPDWDKAVALAKELAVSIPSMSYIGWDFAYDKNNEWVIVEYNSHPEFVQQGPTDHGCRQEFLDTIDIYNKSKKKKRNKKKNNKKKKSLFRRAIRKFKRLIK